MAGAAAPKPGTPRRRRPLRRPPRVLWPTLVLALAVAAGCGALREPHPEAVAVAELMGARDYGRIEALTEARGATDPRHGYRIGPDDLLDVRIPDLIEAPSRTLGDQAGQINIPSMREAPTYQQGMRVNSRGNITLPLLGEVPTEGLTTTELEADLARRLRAADILLKPQVSVQLIEYRNGVVAVMGSFERPGLYPITRPGATIADLMWAAGGPSKDAGRVVTFAPEGVGDPIRIDVEMLLQPDGRQAQGVNVRVVPGDVVSIAPAGSVLIDGWVEKPGSYPVTRGLTLAGAIAAAGGNSFAADREHATVKRSLGPREQHVYLVDLDAVANGMAPDVPLTDGDVVRLPLSRTRAIPWGFYKLASDLVRIGGSIPLF